MPRVLPPRSTSHHRLRFPPVRRTVLPIVAVLLASIVAASPAPAAPEEGAGARRGDPFLRGDANGDRRVSLADVLAILEHLHRGRSLACSDAADVDDSGTIEATDFVFLLGTIFYRHSAPPPPWPRVGEDPTPDALVCTNRRAGRGAGVEEPAGPGQEGPGEGVGAGAGPCSLPHGGADTEFILFLTRDVWVHPGQRDLRLPVAMSSVEGVEALTLSVRCDPAKLALRDLDFRGTVLDRARGPSSWSHTFVGLSEEGYLASAVVLDLLDPERKLETPRFETIAHLVLDVPESVRPGEELLITFDQTPAPDDLPPIRNELVRGGRAVPASTCGVRVHVAPAEDVFLRGDANRDGDIAFSDPVQVILHVFGRLDRSLPCPDAADANDDGTIGLTDAVVLLRYLFSGGSSPSPLLIPGIDSPRDDDPLGCGAPP